MTEEEDRNDLHVNVKKKEFDEVLFDSDCCSCMTLVLTTDGKLATSFFGLHTPEVIKFMKKTTNEYYKKLNKEFKRQYKEEKENIKKIKVLKEKQPEITDEALMKLAEDLRKINKDIEKEKSSTEEKKERKTKK